MEGVIAEVNCLNATLELRGVAKEPICSGSSGRCWSHRTLGASGDHNTQNKARIRALFHGKRSFDFGSCLRLALRISLADPPLLT